MNKRRITLVIVGAGIILVSIVGLQLYWIKNAIQVKEQDFNSEIRKTFSEVMRQIGFYEQKKMQDRMLKAFQPNNSAYRFDTSGVYRGGFTTHFRNGQLQIVNQSSLPVNNPFINPVFDEPPKTQKYVDSLIRYELAKNNLKISFTFNIIDRFNGVSLVRPTTQNPEKFSSYIFPFLSNDLIHQVFLTIHFPYEKAYLFRQISLMLIMSTLLIISMIFIFSYAIGTIIKQERLAIVKNDFINNMTHEFKTPISTISLACQALTDPDIVKTKDLYDSYIGIIQEENKRLGSMAEKILQTAIIEKAEMKLNIQEVDMNEVLEDIIKNVQIRAQQKGGEIKYYNEAEKTTVKGDPVHLSNVANNLIDNALKYSFDRPQIAVRLENSENCIRFSIKDNGIGISKNHQKKIFEKMYRVPMGNVHDVKGFGLGLTYVKAIVEKHHGMISVESQPGKGTVFFVDLPFDLNVFKCNSK